MTLYALEAETAHLYLSAIEGATAEDKKSALAQFGDEEPSSIINRDISNGKATIAIEGIMTPNGPSPLARFFGFKGTGYNDIIAAANSLKDDPTITEVTLLMDTLGGSVKGLDQASQALEALAAEKTLIAENHGQIASGGYYLAVAASKIIAMSPLTETGSIGVIASAIDFSEADKKRGIERIVLRSKNAPDKQPSLTTKEGRKVIKKEVDAVERVFIDKIVNGRGVTEQNVLDNFGKGAMLIASDPDSSKPDALKVGMIDSVVTKEIDAKPQSSVGALPAEGGKTIRRVVMDLETLKAEHPELHKQVVASGVSVGVSQERSRAKAHLTMGAACGDMKLATDNIESGAEHTAETNAVYMAAGMNKEGSEARGSESEDNIDTPETDVAAADHEKALAKATAEELGVEYNA